MNRRGKKVLRRLACTAILIPLLMLPAACTVSSDGGYYGGTVGVGIGLDYYEPYGTDYGYGGWGSDYRVAPYRGGQGRRAEGQGFPRGHAYHPAGPSRQVPSIPSGGRSGRGHGSGGTRH